MQVRRESDRAFHDSRILGEGDFVAQVWKEAETRETAQRRLKERKIDQGVVRTANGDPSLNP